MAGPTRRTHPLAMEILDASNLFAYHRGMLEDRERVDRYREAIHAVVKPGDVVVDIGTGTGLLAFFACQAGARRVYAVEAGPIAGLARELCRANGFDDRITIINQVSFRAALPERADVLVTETLWNFGIGEGVVGFLDDARNRLLQPGAAVIPAAVELYLAPIEAEPLHNVLTSMPRDRHGLNFSAMRRYAVNQIHVPRVDPSAFLSQPAHLLRIALDASARPDFGAEATFTVDRTGTLHALAGWFEAELSPGVRLGNVPGGERSSWAHVAFPLERGVAVAPGTAISARIDTVANGTGWRWSTDVAGERFDQTSVFGFPHDAPAHMRRAAAARPRRAPVGDALLFVLSRLSGEASVEELAEELAAANGELFMQPGAAALFVRETAERYGA
jgi:hypothetical protein